MKYFKRINSGLIAISLLAMSGAVYSADSVGSEVRVTKFINSGGYYYACVRRNHAHITCSLSRSSSGDFDRCYGPGSYQHATKLCRIVQQKYGRRSHVK